MNLLTIAIVLLRKMHLQFLPDLWILCHFFQALRLTQTGLFMGKKQWNRVRNLLFQLHETKIILENTEQTTKW